MLKVIEKIPSAHLVIAGRDSMVKETGTSYLELLKPLIPEEKNAKFTFLGNVENNKLNSEIEKAEICVYPSQMEAMPLAWLEVLSSSKAFIGSNTGPGPEVVKHKKTGLTCNPFDIETLADAIVALLGNPDYAQKLGKNALEDIKQRFSKETLIQKNISLYRKLTD